MLYAFYHNYAILKIIGEYHEQLDVGKSNNFREMDKSSERQKRATKCCREEEPKSAPCPWKHVNLKLSASPQRKYQQ